MHWGENFKLKYVLEKINVKKIFNNTYTRLYKKEYILTFEANALCLADLNCFYNIIWLQQ